MTELHCGEKCIITTESKGENNGTKPIRNEQRRVL